MTSVILFLHAALIFSASLCWGDNCSSINDPRLCEVDYAKNVEELVKTLYEDLSLDLPEPQDTGANCGTKCSEGELDYFIQIIDNLTKELESIDEDKGDLDAAVEQFMRDRDWEKLKEVVLRVLDPSDPAFKQAEKNTWEEGDSALMAMIHDGDNDLLTLLLDHGLDPTTRLSLNNAALLHEAAVAGNIEIAKQLVSRGTPVDVRADWDATPLHRASSVRRPDMVRWLLQQGADVNARDSNGWTALHHSAANEDDPETVTILLSAGVDRHAINNDKETALGLATTKGNSKVVSILSA